MQIISVLHDVQLYFPNHPFPGIKTFVNEFVAYTSLSGMIKNTNDFYNLTYNYNATYSHTGDLDITVHASNLTQETVLTNGFLSVRKNEYIKTL